MYCLRRFANGPNAWQDSPQRSADNHKGKIHNGNAWCHPISCTRGIYASSPTNSDIASTTSDQSRG